MTLDELKGNNIIDATAGKVETVTPITTGHYASENDPHFSTNDGYRGRPADYNSSMTGRTPTVDNLEAIPREIKQVQSAPIDMNQLNSFDISTLPKKPEPPNELEDALMGDLSAAVDREIESISERMAFQLFHGVDLRDRLFGSFRCRLLLQNLFSLGDVLGFVHLFVSF